MAFFKFISSLVFLMLLSQCSRSAVNGNESGSEPINSKETYEYQNAINRCHKTGGTRVVKVMGELRCF